MTHEVLGELSQHTLTDATEIDLIGAGGGGEGGNVNQRYEMYTGHVHVPYGYIICVVA